MLTERYRFIAEINRNNISQIALETIHYSLGTLPVEEDKEKCYSSFTNSQTTPL